MKRFSIIPVLMGLICSPAVLAPQPALAADDRSGLCVVTFKGRVTELVNPDGRLDVEIGDKIVGAFTYDPDVVIGHVDPGPSGGPFPVNPLLNLSFSVGSLSATLDPVLGGFI